MARLNFSPRPPFTRDEAKSPFMTPGEVAAIFRVHPKTVVRWTWPPGAMIKTPGGHCRFRRDAVEALYGSPLDSKS